MDISKLSKSKILIWVIAVIFEVGIILCAFRVGMVVGFNKANYSLHWGENYHQLFGRPRHSNFGPITGSIRDFIGEFDKDDFSSGHGVVGTIIKVDTSTIMVKASDNTEKSLLLSSQTTIRRGDDTINISDIKENDRVVALGSPSSTGQIEVKFLRVFQP